MVGPYFYLLNLLEIHSSAENGLKNMLEKVPFLMSKSFCNEFCNRTGFFGFLGYFLLF